MKKRLMIVAAALALALTAVGCGGSKKPTMTMDVTETSALITLNKADKNDNVMSGSLIVAEGDNIVITPRLEGTGNVLIKIIQEPDDQTIDTLPNYNKIKPSIEETMAGDEPLTCSIDPGSYMVSATAMSPKVKGSVTINVINSEDHPYELWTKTDSAEAAAKAAGLDGFELPMDAETDLGKVADSKDYMHFRYLDNTVQADFPMAAVDMVVRKSTKDYATDETNMGRQQYKYEWTQDVNGIEATCFGNREGDATKTVWKNGNYGYCILATGAGGDDDFGLSENDVAVWVEGVK
ncbi:MAG: hypothetical protein Q4A32_08590 [Lachnospiraceae bacterium]|nr:hypothetical protein [Lachnospiraceae bacterium]